MNGPRGVRVLCVDDNPDVALILATFFNLSGFEVRDCLDGPTALTVADEFRPHACVLDVNMPGMDGCELARRLRERFGAQLRIIAVSGDASDDLEQRIAAAGFDSYLAKPPDLDRLLALVAEAGSLVEPG